MTKKVVPRFNNKTGLIFNRRSTILLQVSTLVLICFPKSVMWPTWLRCAILLSSGLESKYSAGRASWVCRGFPANFSAMTAGGNWNWDCMFGGERSSKRNGKSKSPLYSSVCLIFYFADITLSQASLNVNVKIVMFHIADFVSSEHRAFQFNPLFRRVWYKKTEYVDGYFECGLNYQIGKFRPAFCSF